MTIKLDRPWKQAFWREAYLAALTGGACAFRATERADTALEEYLKRTKKETT